MGTKIKGISDKDGRTVEVIYDESGSGGGGSGGFAEFGITPPMEVAFNTPGLDVGLDVPFPSGTHPLFAFVEVLEGFTPAGFGIKVVNQNGNNTMAGGSTIGAASSGKLTTPFDTGYAGEGLTEIKLMYAVAPLTAGKFSIQILYAEV